MICNHATTFDCHGTQRCSTCYVDSFVLRDGTRTWPAQDHPDTWDAERIARWWFDNRLYLMSQGCDGFEFCRNNVLQGQVGKTTYGYVWVELTLDLDLEMAWLLDVRTHDGQDETRRFLFVGTDNRTPDAPNTAVFQPDAVLFAQDSAKRGTDGIRWFADQVDEWTAAWSR